VSWASGFIRAEQEKDGWDIRPFSKVLISDADVVIFEIDAVGF